MNSKHGAQTRTSTYDHSAACCLRGSSRSTRRPTSRMAITMPGCAPALPMRAEPSASNMTNCTGPSASATMEWSGPPTATMAGQSVNGIGRLMTENDGDFGSGADHSDYTYDVMVQVLSPIGNTLPTILWRRDWSARLTPCPDTNHFIP